MTFYRFSFYLNHSILRTSQIYWLNQRFCSCCLLLSSVLVAVTHLLVYFVSGCLTQYRSHHCHWRRFLLLLLEGSHISGQRCVWVSDPRELKLAKCKQILNVVLFAKLKLFSDYLRTPFTEIHFCFFVRLERMELGEVLS